MSLWSYDVVFFRVMCVSLVAIGFIFTVILTNVFVDVDGYLMPKPQNKQSTEMPEITPNKRIKQDYLFEEQNYIDDDSTYRARRSLDFHENISTKRNPNINKVLSSQLAQLLEELDEEESLPITKITTTTPTTTSRTTWPTTHEPNQQKQSMVDEHAIDINVSNEAMHHALHEILLEGIQAHIDIGQIYNRLKNVKKVSHDIIKKKKDRSNEEHLIINEIRRCKKLEDDVEKLYTEQNTKATEATEKSFKHKDHSIILKSEVQIWNEDKKNQQNFTNGKIKGFIKVIYNGKLVNLTQMQNNLVSSDDDSKRDTEEMTTKKVILKYRKKNDDIAAIRKLLQYKTNLPIFDSDRALIRLLRRLYLNNKELRSAEELQNTAERHKRQINNHYVDSTSNKSKTAGKNAKIEEYKHIDIEIETHFDGKDVKGGRKQFINHLIDKIRNALRSDADKLNNRIQNELELHKRDQEPIYDSDLALHKSKIIPPFDKVERREVDKISKILNGEIIVYDKIENVSNRRPKFLSTSKTVNSAEMQKLNINYDRVTENGVAKRFQKPITDTNVENDDIHSQIYSDLGNVSFLLNNIDGTGFSIGFNQYQDEPPDKESLREFNGIENLIKEYHNVQDYSDLYSHIVSHDTSNMVENQHRLTKRYVNLLPWKKNKTNENLNGKSISTFNASKHLYIFKPITVNKIVSYIKSKKRTRRSINLQKITQVKPNKKIKKYLNTNIMNEKKVFKKNRRSKRHIDNIRIIAESKITPIINSSDEDMHSKSDNTYSNKASSVKQSNLKDIIIKTQSDELYDYAMPFNRIYNVKSPSIKSLYEINSYKGPLMSKYPHILIENNNAFKSNAYESEIMKNKRIGSKPKRIQFIAGKKISSVTSSAEEPLLDVQDILNAIMPKSRYEIAMNILPQHNSSGSTHTGFKEIHTTVNKSFEKNGLHYISLLNLSAVSKIEKRNTSGNSTPKEPLNGNIKSEESREKIDKKNILTQQKRKIDEQLANLVKENRNLDNIIHDFYSIGKDSSKKSFNTYINIENDPNGKTFKLEDYLRKKLDANNNDFIDSAQVSKDKEVQNTKSTKPSKNITAEILSRIDSNANILQAFLDKLYNKIEIVPQYKDLNKKEQATSVMSEDLIKLLKKNIPVDKVNETVPIVRHKDLKQYVMKLQIPNMIDQKVVYSQKETSKDLKKPASDARPNSGSNTNNIGYKLNNTIYYFDAFGAHTS